MARSLNVFRVVTIQRIKKQNNCLLIFYILDVRSVRKGVKTVIGSQAQDEDWSDVASLQILLVAGFTKILGWKNGFGVKALKSGLPSLPSEVLV